MAGNKWVNRVQKRPEVRAETKPTLIPAHMSQVVDDAQTDDVQWKQLIPETKDGVLFLPARFEIFWENHSEVVNENQHIPPAVLPLPDPMYFEDVRQFRDKVRQLYGLRRLGLDIRTLISHITPAQPPNAYETTLKLRVG